MNGASNDHHANSPSPLHNRAWGTAHPSPRASRPLVLAAVGCSLAKAFGTSGPWLYVSNNGSRILTADGSVGNGTLIRVLSIAGAFALLALLWRTDLTVLGWLAFAAIGLCLLAAAVDWFLLESLTDVALARTTVIRTSDETAVAWGLVTTCLASATGAAIILKIARDLTF